jgi:uncharacterized protein YacL
MVAFPSPAGTQTVLPERGSTMDLPRALARVFARVAIWPITFLRQGVLHGLSSLEIFLGGLGVVAALLVAALLSPALNQLPGPAGDFAPIGVAVLLLPIGIAVALGRRPEVDRFIHNVRERTDSVTGAIATPTNGRGAGRSVVVDTSAIIDGRLADVIDSGFVLADLIVPRFILDELRRVADSSDPLKRRRGRHGLQLLARIQASDRVRTVIDETDFPDMPDVDAKVLALARSRSAALITTDFNLNRVAGVEDVPVLNMNALAQAVRVVALPGESLTLEVHQEGSERSQGVGFLADGTMVVVEDCSHLVGHRVTAEVTRVIQTAAGRMLFANLREVDPQPEPATPPVETSLEIGTETGTGGA